MPPALSPSLFGRAPGIVTAPAPLFTDDDDAIDYFNRCKKECFADRWLYERMWTRNIHYVNMRQWLAPYSRLDGWRDSRIARNIPKPCTSKPKEGVQAIRAMFTAANLGVDVRPITRAPKSVSTAKLCDDLAPLLHDAQDMDDVLSEADYWYIVTGNIVFHPFWDVDSTIDIPYERCLSCGLEVTSDQIATAGQKCPNCQKPAAGNFTEAIDPKTGAPRVEKKPQGRGRTEPLSMLEVAFPLQRPRWGLVDMLIRLRWRTKRYYEEHPELSDYVKQINWSSTSSERSLQIFQSLPYQTELGGVASVGRSGSADEEGVAEYELWKRPTPAHPDGLVMRVAGDSAPVVLHIESEGLPGPLPYHDIKGRPLWPFALAAYEHVGGRVIGSSALDPVISRIDALNRLDSIVEMIMTRTASPHVTMPKGSEVEWLGDSPGMPGLLLQYNPQVAGGSGEPKFVQGIGPDASFAQLRRQIVDEIDAGLGTFDILKGQRPAGVKAFSAMQLLVERGEARFARAFQSRAKAYRDVCKMQMEIERQFGPGDRVKAVATPARSYAFQTFMEADLDQEVVFEVADGSTTPKTALGERAAIEHYKQLGGVNMQDPDTRYAVAKKLGLTDIEPGIDSQHQFALRNQQAFEEYLESGKVAQVQQQATQAAAQPTVAPQPGQSPPAPPPTVAQLVMADPLYPFRWKRWYDAAVHRLELVKWAIDDHTVELLTAHPEGEALIDAYLQTIEQVLSAAAKQPPVPPKISYSFKGPDLVDPQVRAAFDSAEQLPPPAPPSQPPAQTPPQGAGRAAANSNQNSAPAGNTPQPAVPGIM